MSTLVVETKTKYDERTYKALNKLMLFGRTLLIDIIGILLIVAGTLMLIFDFNKVIAFIYLGFGVICPIACYIIYVLLVKKSIKDNNRINGSNMEVFFSFYDDHVELVAHSQRGEAKNSLKYSQYFKIKESKEFFFLFITGNQVQAVDKSKLSKEDLEKLTNLLKEKFNKKK